MNTDPKILIVDDRVENLIALEILLEKCQAEFIRASSGNDALLMTLKHDFALAIVDVQMPGMDGYELVELMRSTKKNSDLPVLFVSAIHKDDYYKIKGAETGALDFITKPLIPEIIKGKVDILLQLYLKQQEIFRKNIELKKKIKELKHKNKELVELANIFSHDLQEPIRKFISFSSLLTHEHDTPSDPEQQFFINRMLKAAHDVETLLDSMIVYSYAQLKVKKIEKVRLSEIFEKILNELNIKYDKHNYSISKNKELPRIYYGDSKLIEILFEQILDNSFKYSTLNNTPRITIDSQFREKNLIISITDNGTIIPKEKLSRLFLPLFRLYSNEEFEGVGMGLTIANKIVLRHGGKIKIRSSESTGTTVNIILPLVTIK